MTGSDIWSSKLRRVHDPKMEPLTRLGDEVHRATGEEVPYFDPDDGGKVARVLFLFRHPGPTVRTTKFISRENCTYNPRDQSAKNFIEANDKASKRALSLYDANAAPLP